MQARAKVVAPFRPENTQDRQDDSGFEVSLVSNLAGPAPKAILENTANSGYFSFPLG